MVEPVPAAYRTVIPYLTIRDAPRAIEFYGRAFGAAEITRHAKSPQALGGTPVTLQLFFANVDAAWKRALDAGAEVAMELMDAFWGDRYGVLTDPFGHRWGMSQRIEEVSSEEMERRAAAWFAEGD